MKWNYITFGCARQVWRRHVISRLGILCLRLVSSPTGSIPWRYLTPQPPLAKQLILFFDILWSTLRIISVLAAIFCPLIENTSVLFTADMLYSFEISWLHILLDRWRKMANCLKSISSNLSIVVFYKKALKYMSTRRLWHRMMTDSGFSRGHQMRNSHSTHCND